MTDKIVVLTTCGSEDEANRIAQELIERHLAACVNILPKMQSVYRWKGAIERADEILLIAKSRRGAVRRLAAEITRLHSYETPEMLVLPVVDGTEEYLAWVDREVVVDEEP